MTAPLYLIDLRPDPAALIRFAEDQGIDPRKDEDLGYAAHAWLTALFGQEAPKPFRLLQDRRNLRPPRLLAFSRLGGRQLAERAETWAEQAAEAKRAEHGPESAEYDKARKSVGVAAQARLICPLRDDIPSKAMPERWRAGRRLGFELLACPVSRLGKNEDDVYRRHRRERDELGEAPDSRAEVYRAWLARQLGGAATLLDCRLDGFRNARLLRKAAGNGRRDFLAPQALLGGVLRVEDGAAFTGLLARGVGRHRAFGFGMLLPRPAP